MTLSTKDNVNLTKQLSSVFKRPIYWTNFETIPAKVINKGSNYINYLLHDFKVIKIFLFLLMLLLKMKNIMYWLMEEIFTVNQSII